MRGSTDIRQAILAYITANPGLAAYEIADGLGFPRRVVAGYLSNALWCGLIVKQRDFSKPNSEGKLTYGTNTYRAA